MAKEKLYSVYMGEVKYYPGRTLEEAEKIVKMQKDSLSGSRKATFAAGQRWEIREE
jgi:hypothetical protein